MAQRPQDRVDLYLAPVALGFDAALDSLAGLSPEELAREFALRTNREPRTVEERREVLIEALEHVVDTHGWRLGWDERGLEISHETHRLVLGLPGSLRDYLADTD